MRFGFAAPPLTRRLTAAALFGLLLAALTLPTASSVAAATSCQRVFGGNSSGSRDVTGSLTAWLARYHRQRLCLKSRGVYRIDGTVRIDGMNGLRLDGRSSTLTAHGTPSASQQRNQLLIVGSRNIVISNLRVRGTNTDASRWIPERQQEHGISIFGGSYITLSRVAVSNTYGDGVYIGYLPGRYSPPTHTTLTHLSVSNSGRNGIGVTGGSYLRILYSSISNSSLSSVDLEPDFAEANIHHVLVMGSTMRGFGLSGAYTGWAFAANGKAGSMRSIAVESNRGYPFDVTIQNEVGGTHRGITFRNNRSSPLGHAYFMNIAGLSVGGNVGISVWRSHIS